MAASGKGPTASSSQQQQNGNGPSPLPDSPVPSPIVPLKDQMVGERSAKGTSSAPNTPSGPMPPEAPTAFKDRAGGIFGWGGVFDLGSTFASFRQPSPPDVQPEISTQKQNDERVGPNSLAADLDALGTDHGIGAEGTPSQMNASGRNPAASKPVPSNVWVPRPEDN